MYIVLGRVEQKQHQQQFFIVVKCFWNGFLFRCGTARV